MEYWDYNKYVCFKIKLNNLLSSFKRHLKVKTKINTMYLITNFNYKTKKL